jgi:hypothetical protein
MLDSNLVERLRDVLAGTPVTEAELRKLTEESRAWVLILEGQLARRERRLGELTSRPTGSLAEIAAAFRHVNELRPDLDELQTLVVALHERAREFRAAWLAVP